MKKIIFLLLATGFLAGAARAADIQILIMPDEVIGPISPYIFGTNYGPWTFLNPGARPAAKAAGLTLIRYPGGEWGDQNDLMEYQIDEAVALAKELGAEPLISVRLANGSIENAVNLVKYANQTKKYNIKYWSIGNESNLYATGKLDIAGYDTARLNKEWRQFAEAMRAAGKQVAQTVADVDSPRVQDRPAVAR